ncbi:MAG TPA: ABC transporter ATP-binding protein [Chloroflexi bacterium]|nr:ABC transporter ATP-binding protein [Chloroflexota bacterium]
MSEQAVQLNRVSKKFGSVVAVNDVSLSIADGEFFSLLGPSGCGKTTTLRLIAGFELPTRGEVYIGQDLQGETPPYRRPVNTVFQNYALFPHMTISRNVGFGLEMRKLPRDEIQRRVSEALDMVQLPGMGERKPSQLSGGQQQRVALARALVNQPKVLLLDEPLGALDLKLRKAMQLELKALQHRIGITFVYVTHDQEEALTMSDRIAVMNGGRVLQIGTPEEIYERPANRFVADFIGETNFLEGQVTAGRPGEATVQVEDSLTIPVSADKAVGKRDVVTVAIRPEKISLHAEPPDDRAVAGVIEEVIYTGTDTRYLVRIGEQTIVTVRQQNVGVGEGASFLKGASIYLHWRLQSARLLTA